MLRTLIVPIILLLQMLDARAEQPQVEDRIGDTYEIRLESVSETFRDGSSGNSRSRMSLVERVTALHVGAIELEFDLPDQASAEDRARTWQFPARVLKPTGRLLELLNGSELETRLRAWLQKSKMTEAECGRWVFTWTAIKIECDPKSVLHMLEPFDLRPGDLHEGALHHEPGAQGPAPLQRNRIVFDSVAYAAQMRVDADMVRQERARADVAIAQITGKEPLGYEAALQARKAEQISGSITSTFEVDSAGRVTRRRRVTQIEIAGGSGPPERQTTTVTIERRLVSPSKPRL